jgi:carboxyl-terminal processing protease
MRIWVILVREDASTSLKIPVSIFRAVFLTATVSLAASWLFAQVSPTTPPDDVAAQALRFTSLLGAVEQHYMDPIDPDHLIFDGGIRGMLSTLDPFCAFLDRDQFELLKQQARGEALGFGSILYLTPGKVLILQTTQGSPSGRAGLGPGDEIVEINGQRVDRLEFQELIDLLQRSRTHPVRLGIIHPGRLVPQDFDLNPAEVAMPSVDKAFLWAPGIAYVHVNSFELKTPQEVDDALVRQGAAHLKGLLLDLRDDHGGIVDAAVGVASLFLKPKTLVLTTRGRHLPAKTYMTTEMPHSYTFPIVVLVNGETASASEVLAAALQEHDRAVVAGEPTYGKGVVQSVMELSEQTGLALTAGQYFTPSGRSIQRPLAGTALTFATLDPSAGSFNMDKTTAGPEASPPVPPTFRTDDGRPVTAGGGINPDVIIPKNRIDPWLAFILQRGYLTSYAEEYMSTHGKIDETFEPPPEMLEDFKFNLERNGVRVPTPYWLTDQDFLKLHLKVELTNLVFGLARGDEVETKGDPQAQEAASLFPRVSKILHGH